MGKRAIPSFTRRRGLGWLMGDMKRHNRIETKVFRQRLRREATPFENDLWLYLRKSSLNGFKFRRQHGIGPYIVDFYCPAARLVVEIDGDSHGTPSGKAKDQERDAYLSTCHVNVLRFSNRDVKENILAVVEKITEVPSHINPSRPPL